MFFMENLGKLSLKYPQIPSLSVPLYSHPLADLTAVFSSLIKKGPENIISKSIKCILCFLLCLVLVILMNLSVFLWDIVSFNTTAANVSIIRLEGAGNKKKNDSIKD